jgi:hypothetical protein
VRRVLKGALNRCVVRKQTPGWTEWGGPWITLLWLLPALQHLAHWEEGKVSQLTLHGLAGDPVPGSQTSRHPDPWKPGERAHLLLPVTPGLGIPA